jgi:hypothetical protein
MRKCLLFEQKKKEKNFSATLLLIFNSLKMKIFEKRKRSVYNQQIFYLLRIIVFANAHKNLKLKKQAQ